MLMNHGDYVNPIERAAVEFLEAGGSEYALTLLQQAYALAQRLEERQPDELEATRESIRRSAPLAADDLRRLREAALRIGTESRSPLNQYALIELVQAAAVGGAALPDRIETSRALAVAARKFGRFERARAAYADALEGIQILVRFYRADATAARDAEAQIRRDWEAVQVQYPGQPALFASLADDPSEEWLRILIWNTDAGPSHGALVHADAVMRLAARFEDAQDSRGESLAPHVVRLRELLDGPSELTADRDPRWRVGALQAVGDALMEVSQWSVARDVHEQAARQAEQLGQDTLALHSTAQAACCDLFEGARARAMDRLSGLAWPRWQALAQMAVSVAADVARLEAVRYACRRTAGDAAPVESEAAVTAHLGVVSLVAHADARNRSEYLQALFAAVTSRDVNSVLPA